MWVLLLLVEMYLPKFILGGESLKQQLGQDDSDPLRSKLLFQNWISYCGSGFLVKG